MADLAFGRKVIVTIYPQDKNPVEGFVFESNLMEGKRGLKITGTIKKQSFTQPPSALIDIYNLSPVQTANILAARYKQINGKTVEVPLRCRVEAGYRNSFFGKIFDGQILKPTMVKPDANNTILRLNCIDGANFTSAVGLTQTFNDGINYFEIAKQVVNHADANVNLIVGEELKNYKVDGSFVTRSTDWKTLEDISDETECVFTYNNDTIYIDKIENIMTAPSIAFILNSQTGLVGFPALETSGVTVQSVLNPNLDVLGLIQLNNGDISVNQQDYLTNREIGAWLSSDGLYRIIELTHSFDTTTGAFTTSCRCLARDYYTLSTST